MKMIFGNHLRHSSAAFVGLAAVACLCAPAENASAKGKRIAREHALNSEELNSEEVNVADLHLGQPTDRNILKQRIHLAAVRVCNFDGFLSVACVDIASVDALNQAHHLAGGDASIGATAATVLIVSGVRD
jgi:UrcA family protein